MKDRKDVIDSNRTFLMSKNEHLTQLRKEKAEKEKEERKRIRAEVAKNLSVRGFANSKYF